MALRDHFPITRAAWARLKRALAECRTNYAPPKSIDSIDTSLDQATLEAVARVRVLLAVAEYEHPLLAAPDDTVTIDMADLRAHAADMKEDGK